MNKKLIIIGIDGGTFQIMDPLLKRGALPFFGGLIERGARGKLRSTMPPVTAPAWTSFMTGKEPSSHGLFDFQVLDERTGEKRLTSSADCRSATLWDYLGEAGKEMVLVNVPMTYPPMPINGVCVAGFPVPQMSEYSYPPQMQKFIQGRGYVTDWVEMAGRKRFSSRVGMMKEVEKIRLDVFSAILSEHRWDLAMVVVSGTDHVSHREWQKGNRAAVEDFYVFIDGLLGKFSSGDCHYLLMSDHGFTSADRVFYMNSWLREEGYISYEKSLNRGYDEFASSYYERGGMKDRLGRALSWLGLTKDNLKYLGKKTGLVKLERHLPDFFVRMFPAEEMLPLWEKTTAYMASMASKGVNINLRGRESGGIVPEDRYEELRREIIAKLRGLKGDDGEPVFSVVEPREKVYPGPHAALAPDIVVWPGRGYNVRMLSGRGRFMEEIRDARHDTEGIFVFSGGEARRGAEVSARIEDIAPTVMHFMGVACPGGLDGKVVEGCFAEGSESASRPVRLREPMESKTGGSGTSDAQEKAEVSEKLQALGYI
jgi:predicted AlkP superfamily phosphohydrolase/phosphomutase